MLCLAGSRQGFQPPLSVHLSIMCTQSGWGAALVQWFECPCDGGSEMKIFRAFSFLIIFLLVN